jgi:chromosome segregation ATPase
VLITTSAAAALRLIIWRQQQPESKGRHSLAAAVANDLGSSSTRTRTKESAASAAAAADSDSGYESVSGSDYTGKQIRSAAAADSDGLNSSSSSRKDTFANPVEQQGEEGTAAAECEKAEVPAEVRTATDTLAKLKADVDAAEQEKLGLTVHTVQLSAENTGLQFKLSTAADSLHSTSIQLTEAETKLSAAETTLTTASAELKQQAAANAALTAANAEYEKKTAEHAKTAALLGEKLCSVRVMVRGVLPNEVSKA